jgi:hypothetical protein
MLVGGTYRFRADVDQRAGLKRFQAWQPPAGFTFQGHWTMADGMGGMFIAEVDKCSRRVRGVRDFRRSSGIPNGPSAGRHGVGADQRAGVRLDRLDQLTLPDRLDGRPGQQPQ